MYICPECKSKKIEFDSHAGFAYCLGCGANSEKEGPDYFKIVDKQTK
jgi:transcription initiation factor TFIIIB Brf1 subunit/transcription initiation factor TFIIB